MSERRQHPFNKILKDLKAGALTGACLLYGHEQFLVTWAKDQIIKRFVNPATEALDLVIFEKGIYDFEKLKESCETMPVFSERKVVVLEGFDAVFGKYSREITQSDQEQVAELVCDIPESTLLVITCCEDPDPKKKNKTKLFNSLTEHGRSYDFSQLSQGDLKKFINKRFRTAGKNISPSAMDLLINNSGYFNNDIDYALYNLENDVMKIIALSAGTEVTEKDVLDGISDNLESGVFKMLDAISENRKDNAFRLLNDLLRSGVSEMQILATIAGQLELMLQVKELNEESQNQVAISKKIKVHEFRVKKALGFVRSYTEKDLRRILSSAFQTDYRIKTGMLDGKLALEMLIAEM